MWYILAANINMPIDSTKTDLWHAGVKLPGPPPQTNENETKINRNSNFLTIEEKLQEFNQPHHC